MQEFGCYVLMGKSNSHNEAWFGRSAIPEFARLPLYLRYKLAYGSTAEVFAGLSSWRSFVQSKCNSVDKSHSVHFST